MTLAIALLQGPMRKRFFMGEVALYRDVPETEGVVRLDRPEEGAAGRERCRGFRVSGSGFRVSCFRFWFSGFGFRIADFGFRCSIVRGRVALLRPGQGGTDGAAGHRVLDAEQEDARHAAPDQRLTVHAARAHAPPGRAAAPARAPAAHLPHACV